MKVIKHIAVMTALAMVLAGCRRENPAENPAEIEADMPISFGVEAQEMAGTRATALYYYQTSMKLNGMKATNTTINGKDTVVYTNVFPLYRLQYVESSNSWEYEPDKHDSIPDTQIAKYWDMDASNYYFVAGSPFAATTINSKTRNLEITGLSTAGAGSSSGTISTAYLFSYPVQVDKNDFNKKVTLTFRLAMCRILVTFVDSTGAHDGKINLTDIQFGPAGNGYYYTNGNLLLADGPGVGDPSGTLYHTETVGTDSTQSPRNYQSLALPAQATGVDGTKTDAIDVYYMIPQANSDWKLTIGSLQTYKAATVPASYMRWQPAHQYTYRFVLRNNSTDPDIKFIDCVRTAINEWKTGTNFDSNVYNW